MKSSLVGRVNNLSLPAYKGIHTVFETIVNAIDSIEESELKYDGKIEIFFERVSQIDIDTERESIEPIHSIHFSDTGIGFNAQNYSSFETLDSTYKAKVGGKGVGRLLWLKAFSLVKVESIYIDDNKTLKKRIFDFSFNEITNDKIEVCSSHETPKTKISLIKLDKSYSSSFPKKLSTIAEKIILHLISRFSLLQIPQIIIKDNKETINLNSLFERDFKPLVKNIDLESGCELSIFKYLTTEESSHRLYLTAHKREVSVLDVNKHIPNLTGRLKDEQNNEFITISIIEGNYLDENVGSERLSFVDNSGNTPDLFGNSIEIIKNSAIKHIESKLQKNLDSIEEIKTSKIKKFTEEKAPQYRHLLKHKSDSFRKIDPNLSDQKLEIELHKINQEYEIEIREDVNKILTSGFEEIEENKETIFQKLHEINKSQLVKYVIHRKLVLDLFSKRLNTNQNSYSKEDEIHEIFFPMKTSSDEILYNDHNLWLIDEKLAYHHFLGSDIPLKRYQEVEIQSNDRPDILVFNKALSFVDSEDDYSSVVIIEFKRPMRDDYSDDKNPIEQILGYVQNISKGNVINKKGRPYKAFQTTPFYAYIVCDITPKMKDHAEKRDMTLTPDGQGYFGFNKNYNLYYEIISFDKVLDDAKKRNRALFDELKISSI